ncbi:MAG: hypothetical protein LBV38_02880 [Alistipes sp.]|jgi:hypothetical protein|nr:hypothetical protein [Alistipes sp.]
MLLAAGLVFGGALLVQAGRNATPMSGGQTRDSVAVEGTTTSGAAGGEKTPVDITAAVAYRTPDLDENAVIMVGEVAFHHNGAVISCDSAIRYSDRRIECFKNVIINKDSTFVYGDRAEYNGELNLARVYSPVIKVIDGDATLYTYNFTFNTLDNIGRWFGGGVMYQQDNVMESEVGYFFSDLHELVAVREVEMRNDSHRIVSDSVRYNTETKVASFYTRTYIWTDTNEMISALNGRYNTRDSTYFFWDNAYVLDEFRETWADTIDFNARAEDGIFYGNVQIDDREHDSSAFGDLGRYWGARGETMLTRRPALLNYDADQGNADTLYMRADTVFMYVRYPSDSPSRRDSLAAEGGASADRFAHLKWVDSLPDSVRVAMADSLVPVIAALRSEIGVARGRADSIMNVLYPPAATSEVSEVPTANSLPVVDSLLPAVEQIESEIVEATPTEPERVEPAEVAELRERATELTTRLDSLSAAESYIRPQAGGGTNISAADSLAQVLRLDSLARIARTDSLALVDSIRVADPKAFRAMQKAEAKRLKLERQREKAELREAKFAAKAEKRAERTRLRAEKRAAKAAQKAAAKELRRRLAAEKRGRIFEPSDSAADSLARADSLVRLDSMRLDSLRTNLIDSLASAPADTTATAPDTTMRIFRGWHDVRIWRRDMQAVCDSMVGFSADSTVHMYTDPILWHGENQVTGDSITLFMAGGEIDHAEFFGDPIMGSQVGGTTSRQFNQVKGRTMTSWFSGGELRRHDTRENAQSLYYMQEEERTADGGTVMSLPLAFIVASADNMSFLFEADSLRYIVMRQQVEDKTYPMTQIPGTQPTMLSGFVWRVERRPALGDVFDRRVRPSERTFHEELPGPEFPIAARIDRRREYLIQNLMWGDRTDPLPAYAVEFREERYRPEAASAD